MTHPLSFTRPLLIHTLAAALLCCPVAFAKTKNQRESEKQSPPAAAPKSTPAKTGAGTQKPASAQKNIQPQKPLSPAKPAPAKPAPANPAAAKPAAKTTPPPAPQAKNTPAPRARQTQGDGPRAPERHDHRALIAPLDELLARIPTTGRLDEEDCILLAIVSDPELLRRRAEIQDAVAKRQAVKDLENPELRLSYGSQSDDYIRNPYVERTFEQHNETEDRTSTQTTTGLATNPGEVGFGEVITDVETGTTTTSRFREIERIVTPGRNGDTVTTNIFEHRLDNDTGIRDRTIDLNGFIQQRRDSLVENMDRTLRSSVTETTTGGSNNGDQETFSALIRFQMPHPWQKKARLERAASEIMLAEAQYLAAEDKIVREVRALFNDLNVKQSTNNAHEKRRQNFSTFRSELDKITSAANAGGNAALASDFAVDAIRASIDMADVLDDSFEANDDIDSTRAAIARLCNIPDFDRERIYSPGITTRRIVDYRTLSQSYLVEMALLYRADAVASRARFGIAKAFYAEAKAAKIPWATFIDAGYTRQWRDGYGGSEDEWMIRIGFEIPFFDWTGINKRDKEYKKAAVAWETQFEAQRKDIEVDVSVTLGRVKRAWARLKATDDIVAREKTGLAERLRTSETLGVGAGGFSKNLRMKYDAGDAVQRLEIGRYRAYSDYNKALMELEDAIGIRIERALEGEFQK